MPQFVRTYRASRLTALAALTLAIAAAVPTWAADTSEPAPAPATPGAAAAANPLAGARKLIAEKKWAGAIDELKRVNATQSADWNNLMGYTHRKAKTPDLAAAERYYDAALRIDANHRGALEYSGELALVQGNLGRAEQRLASLDKACAGKCEELDDLKGAITRFKANGNKFVSKD